MFDSCLLYQTWPVFSILDSGWFNYESLKPLGQMNQILVVSIYGRSSIKIAHFVPIRYQSWPS